MVYMKKSVRLALSIEIALLITLGFLAYYQWEEKVYSMNVAVLKYKIIADNAIAHAQEKDMEMEAFSKQMEDYLNGDRGLVGELYNYSMQCKAERESLQTEITNKNLEIQATNLPFIEEMEKFSNSRNYDINEFNCVDFSSGALGVARKIGYSGYVKVVQTNCDYKPEGVYCDKNNKSKHAIVVIEVPFEVTERVFPIPPSLFKFYGLEK